MVKIREATVVDAKVIGVFLSPEDRAEIEKLYGKVEDTPHIIMKSLACSVVARTIEKNGMPLAIFGVARGSKDLGLSNLGVPWLLCAKGYERVAFTIAKHAKAFIKEMFERQNFDALMNYVSKDRVRTVKWLKSCGFRVAPSLPRGKGDELFHCFYQYKEDAVCATQ